MASNSAPGFDEVKYPMINNLPENAKKFLLQIFNDVWVKGENIDSWKKIVVVPIPKPNKDVNLAESYRPISLLSCIFKTFERMIKNRLEWWLKYKCPLPNNQYGFKRQFGTLDAVANVVTEIQECFTNNSYLAAIFLDIKGAYESVNLHLLKSELCKLDIPPHIAATITNLFYNREIYVRQRNNEKLGPRYTSFGLPQGSVLSPILFNVYTADLHSMDTKLHVVQYADDFVLTYEHKKWDICKHTADNEINRCDSWLMNKGFEISESKSVVTIFTRHNIYINNIQLGKFNFPIKNEVKYLGIILDRKLNWKPFIDSIVAKCDKGLNFLKSTTKTWWGSDQKTALLFYRSYIRSILDYGSIFYGSASNTNLRRIDVVQNKSLRICLGALSSTPIEPLHIEALEPPLQLRREYLSKKFILKTKMKNSNLLDKIHKISISDLVDKFWQKKNSPPLCAAYRDTYEYFNLIESLYPFTPGYEFFDFHIKIPISIPKYSEHPLESNSIFLQNLSQWSHHTQIYTDASKSAHGTGCAYIIPQHNISAEFKLNQESSIFSAEAFAILKAIEHIVASNNGCSNYVIISDSLSVLTSLNNSYPPNIPINPYILNIKKTIHRLYLNGGHIVFMWVKAHIGIHFNEKVDSIAKQSISTGLESTQHLSYDDCVNICRRTIKQKWSNLWEKFAFTNPTRYTKINPEIPSNYWHDKFNLPRKYITVINRIQFGHGCYPVHLNKMGVSASNLCDTCNIEGDLDHIFFNCSKYPDATNDLFNSLLKLNIETPFNLLSLLCLNRTDIINCLISFVHNSGVKI